MNLDSAVTPEVLIGDAIVVEIALRWPERWRKSKQTNPR
jgi:lambda repressor-like predicted transcriptional regulator